MGLARMQGKSVVISGAAFGIGRATAAKFAEEGASLLVQNIQERPLLAFRDELQRNGATVEALVGDVSKVEDCQPMIRAAVETYGRVDVVVERVKRLPRSRAVPNTWKQLRRPIPWDDSASLKRLPTRFCSWRQMRHHSSLAQFSQSMAATWLSRANNPKPQAR